MQEQELGCWLREVRTGLGCRARTEVILEWRRCIALHELEVQTMRTSRVLVGAPNIWGYKVEQGTRARTEAMEDRADLGY